MDGARFRRLCAGIERLSVRQVRELRARLRGLRCAHRGAGADRRPPRGGRALPALRRDGAAALGRDRHRDAAVALQGLPAHLLVDDRHRAGAPPPAREVPAGAGGHAGRAPRARAGRWRRRLGVNRMTVWRWRMRILAALTGHRRERARRHRGGRREVLPRVAQGLAGMGESRARPGALPQAGPPALARLPPARAAAARPGPRSTRSRS